MSSSDTWMPFYVGDYLAATQRLTTEQHGAYMLILMDSWSNGPPPADDRVLSLIARMTAAEWRKAKPALAGFFKVEDGKWVQGRLERERTRANEIIEKRRLAGLASAEARKGQHTAKQKGNTRPTHAGTHVAANGQQTGRPSQPQGSDTDVSAAAPPGDPVKALFDLGVSLLRAADYTEPRARALVGKWRKKLGDDRLRQVLMAAFDKTDPLGWVEKAVNGSADETNELWASIERKYGANQPVTVGERFASPTTGAA